MPYNNNNIRLAKNLRRNMTPWESKLWYEFLHNYPIKFYRQRAIGSYIADFYCAKAKLIVELDGGGHYTPEAAGKDEIRTRYFENIGISVMRICNTDIDENFYGVCTVIDNIVKSKIQHK